MIAATTHIPAYAASISVPEPVLRFGIFAQVAVEDAGQLITRLGTSSEFGGTPSTNGTVTGTTGTVSHGAGDFTPGGSLGGFNGGLYGGMGLCFSSPEDASGNKLAGTATLASGAVIEATYTVTFDEDYLVYGPDIYQQNTSNTIVAQTTGPAVEATGANSAPMRAVDGAETQDGVTWSATTTFTTTDSAVSSTGELEYAQLLFSQHPTFYMENPEASFSVTLCVVSGSLVGVTDDGQTVTYDLAGRTVTAELPVITAP